MSRLYGSLGCCAEDVSQHRSNWDYYDETIIFSLIHWQRYSAAFKRLARLLLVPSLLGH